MEITATTDQKQLLQGFGASVRFSETTMPAHFDDLMLPEERRPKPRRPMEQRVLCEVIDKLTLKQICVGFGGDEQMAFNNALVVALTAEKPMTAGELGQKYIAQQARIEQLERQLAKGGGAAKPITTAELVAAIEARGLTVPLGKRTTKLWRTAAQTLLERDNEMAADIEDEKTEEVTDAVRLPDLSAQLLPG